MTSGLCTCPMEGARIIWSVEAGRYIPRDVASGPAVIIACGARLSGGLVVGTPPPADRDADGSGRNFNEGGTQKIVLAHSMLAHFLG